MEIKPRSPTALLLASQRKMGIPLANGHYSLYLTHITGAYRLTLPAANAAWRGISGNPGN